MYFDTSQHEPRLAFMAHLEGKRLMRRGHFHPSSLKAAYRNNADLNSFHVGPDFE